MATNDYEVPTFEDIFYISLEVAKKILRERVRFDCIVGISRGGLIPTRLLSDFLTIKDIRIIRSIYYTGTGETLDRPLIDISTLGEVNGLKVLIVDDVADTGNTLMEVKNKILDMGARQVLIATLYVKPWRKVEIDFYARETDKWIVFPWEIKEVMEDLINKGKIGPLLKKVMGRRDFNEIMGIIYDKR
ncbi:TPA: phosphoribosyltransferase [Candidatus Geothermarchaeota archaeon]|nr:phosphoribosyltransferase [Candidatus Geothermarchaeota archaeon]HIQ13100.1 phosphoribosyltransferase [Thermoprotei archaeon]